MADRLPSQPGRPVDPPTDPGIGDPYGPVPTGGGPDGWGPDAWGPDGRSRAAGGPDPRRRPVLIALAVLALAVLLLLAWLLTQGRRESDAPGGGPPLPEPTLALERGGFRYSIGVGPFTAALDAPGAGTVEPGRHLLTATVVIRNDTDRPAPALINSDGAAPRLRVGLAGVTELPPINSLGLPRMVSDCLNDPRNPSVFIRADDRYRDLERPTCIVDARTAPAAPTPTGISDRTVAPGAVGVGLVTTVELPESVRPEQASAWLPDATAPDGATEFVRVP